MNKNILLKGIMLVCAVALIAAAVFSVGNLFGFSGLSWANAEKYTVGNAEITQPVRNLDIQWTSGEVNIAYHGESTVTLQEQANKKLSEDQRMRWWLDGDTLRVRYDEPRFRLFSFNNPEKKLTVTLPEGTALLEAEIQATSGAVNIPAVIADRLTVHVTSGSVNATAAARVVSCGVTSGTMSLRLRQDAEDVDVGSTSGSILLEAESIQKVKLGSTSGDILAGVKRAGSFEAQSTSGSVQAVLGEAAQAEIGSTSGTVGVKIARIDTLKIGTTSGSVKAWLPAEPGFTAKLNTVSGRVEYDLPLAKQGDAYVCGDGSGRVSIGTTSGNITVAELAEEGDR